MIEDPLHRRFAGQAQLIRMLLWKIGESTDMAACLEAALSKGMLRSDEADAVRDYLSAELGLRERGVLTIEVDDSTIIRLQRLADKLNRADSA